MRRFSANRVLKAVFAVVALLATASLSQAGEVRLILHADDLGMSHSVNRATFEMLESGRISSASIMMPCPWVPEAADWARRHPNMDIGLHLTLNSEWKSYRWGPVAPRDKVPGLLDADGYLWPSVRQTAMNATPQEVEIELRAQIEKARKMGIRFTHLDSHMGTLFARPDYFEVYEKLGREYGVPIMLMKPSDEIARQATPMMLKYMQENEERFVREGIFRLDSLLTDPARGTKTIAERRAAYHEALRKLPAGVHQIILHPGILEPELSAATASAANRDGDYRIFMDPATVKLMKELNIKLVGWQDVAPGRQQASPGAGAR